MKSKQDKAAMVEHWETVISQTDYLVDEIMQKVEFVESTKDSLKLVNDKKSVHNLTVHITKDFSLNVSGAAGKQP
jgi:hypothetical protein